MYTRVVSLCLLLWNVAAFASVEIPAAIITASNDVADNASIETAVYPAYPEEALEAGVDGGVTLAFVINELGRANDVQVLTAQPTGKFEQTAKVALSLWSFHPAGSESIGCGYARQGAVVSFGFNHAGQPRNTSISGFGLVNNPDPEPEEKQEERRNLERDLKAIRRIEPEYPGNAARFGAEGLVVMEFTVTTEGWVEDIEVIQAVPPRGFTRSAIRAVSKWKFEPAMMDGKVVPRKACQKLFFRISDEDKIRELPASNE